MRVAKIIISALCTIVLIYVLNTTLPIYGTRTPRLGLFLSPSQGFWQNAEPADITFNGQVLSPQLAGKVEVYFDDRLVPHVFADKENDAYFVQGYLHAKFRLWQMEFQTHVAGGRLSEIMGNSKGVLEKDRLFRRLGMVYSAEQSLKALEANASTKNELDAYTRGVNTYIGSLEPATYPLEYKLLDYKPEAWTNLKTELFLKYMSFQLAGWDADFEMTNAQSIFSASDIEKLYPTTQDSLDPILPKGTAFQHESPTPVKPPNADSVYLHEQVTSGSLNILQPDKNNGSNNWAVAGNKTKSGAPILCNDPHLALTLPSLWYEMQICTPGFNVYGVSLPGTPSIIIGFNDSCAWGVTNASRDVKDYYEVRFKDSSMQEYLFNGVWLKSAFRNEVIKVKGQSDVTERIAITRLGPVMYDKHFPNILKNGKYYAVRWTAQDTSNELLAFNKLNHAGNYAQYLEAISHYESPGQNFAFASKAGDIAINQQGKFPAKWQRQGDFLMPGFDSSFAWQRFIPFNENPSIHNPETGFVSSANQLAAGAEYPYYLAGRPVIYRGITINRNLRHMSGITTSDMQRMQTDNYNVFAEMARPLLLKYLETTQLTSDEIVYLDKLRTWNLRSDYNEVGPTIFELWWSNFQREVFGDEFERSKLPLRWPDNSTLLESLIRDSTFKFVDDISTPAVESLREVVMRSFRKTLKNLKTAEQKDLLLWGKYKRTGVNHLLSIAGLSRLQLQVGGDQNTINATTRSTGPGWRMIVELTKSTNALGVYAGGQSGNAGSKYYDNFVDSWALGKYYQLLFLKRQEAPKNDHVKWRMSFSHT